ncbi:hypothetical protein M662_17245 [Bacillus sp. SB49]|uniref:YwmB family TATA-box binding protein n=1 Tax=Bacillaceae TaxID=186817 RepID=UPI0002A4D3D8|nr:MULTISPECIES: YwmB family TATA-box binding protein [Bacillaceae]ELK49057.1 hypothetical protein D479_00465 [Halobacillus sp. BAB-2008]QHT48151.1 hypothetical protein M662_17245 [Bacillus sp. SB49]
MKSVLTGIIALLIIGTGAYPQEMIEGHEELMDIASFAEDKQLEVNEWTITIKETIDASSFEKMQKEILSLTDHREMKRENLKNAVKYSVKNRHKHSDIVESYILIVPKKMKSSVEMVYAIGGQGTPSLEQAQSSSLLKEVKSRLFSKTATIFSCLKANYNGIINDVLVYQEFKEAFNVTTIDEVDEEGWTSRSGHTTEWGQSIPTGDQPMNVQFASRTLGGETNITIGTPIITAEY